MALVLDTGPIVALLDADDADHDRCVRMARAHGDLVVPSPVLGEVDYWVRKRMNADVWETFVDDLAEGRYRLEHPTREDLRRAAALELRYTDLRLGFVDAAVMTICERMGEEKIGTLDRRHFSVVRPRHCAALRILPE